MSFLQEKMRESMVLKKILIKIKKPKFFLATKRKDYKYALLYKRYLEQLRF